MVIESSTRQPNKTKISIVIPALNEEEGIEKTIEAIPKSELVNMGYEVQILVVDNGSTDGTSQVAKKAGAEVVFEPRQGYGRAYRSGFAHAKGDIITTADADSTYPVEDIPKLIKILEEQKLDFLTTNRFALMENGVMPLRNKVGNAILTLTMRLLFGLNIRDSQSGMWVFRSSILDKVKLHADGMPLSEELKIEACHFSHHRWREVPITYRRRIGKEKIKAWEDGISNLLYLLRKRVKR